jgi:hypothetical protein
MRLSRLLWCIAACGALHAGAAEAEPAPPHMDDGQRAFFKAYCVECHNGEVTEGKVRLDDLPFELRDIPTTERWQKILNTLNSGEMPPKEEKQPPPFEKAAFLRGLSSTMVAARKALSDTGGVLTIRRLNKREYEHTIEELLGVKVDAKELPNDGGGGGFDTFGKSLFLSSDQLEQYLALARKALDQAVATGPCPPARKVRIEAEEEANQRITHILRFYQMGGYRAYKRWKASNGKPTTDFGIVDESEMKFRLQVWEKNTAPMIDYLTRPETKTGALLTILDSNPQVGVAIPDEMPPGRYRLRARIGAMEGTEPRRHFVELGVRGKSLEDAMNLIACRKVTAPQSQPEVLEFDLQLLPLKVPLSVEIGPETKKRITLGERVFAFRERLPNNREYAAQLANKAHDETGFGVDPALWIDWVEWEGPLYDGWPTAAHRRIFFKGENAPQDDAYAREILGRFAATAFRGKEVRESYVEKLLGHYRERREAGESFEQALKEPLGIVLASPSFLYLNETGTRPNAPSSAKAAETRPASLSLQEAGKASAPSGVRPAKREVRPLSGPELASRLSYFLWSSPPDAELLELARSGALLQKPVLAAQVDRMLASPKAMRLISGFVQQWLGLERLDFFQFNARLYPSFDDSVKKAAREEVFETVRVILEEDLPVTSLLKADFVVVNELLADFYGIACEGPGFRKVPVPAGVPRGGLLGMAAVLAMGSDGERSSPVERGAWVLRKLLNDPPPPAPANVPQLSRHQGKLLPARELLKAHMEQPQCSQCHQKIDPIGFGLEHFNAVGLWRDLERTEVVSGNTVRKALEHPIDSSGTLPGGETFESFEQLRDGVAARGEPFVRGLIEGLLGYGLGRAPVFSDDSLCEALLAHARQNRWSLRALLQEIVASRPFQSKISS